MRPRKPGPGLGVTTTRGVIWTGAAQVVKQLVQIATAVLLARLLSPREFGLFGMALVFVGVAQMFANFGIGAAIVQSQSTSRLVLSSSFWANVVVGASLAMIVSLAAPMIARFYSDPAVTPVVIVASLTMVLAGAMVVPQSILYRDLRFADIAKVQVAGSVSGSIVAVAMAYAGAGVWSLVAQPIAGSAVAVMMVLVLGRWRPALEFSAGSIRTLVRFSAGVLGSDLVNYAHRNTDTMLIGRFLGSGPLGLYSMAYQMMLFPMQQVSAVLVRVLFPTLSQLRDDLPRFRTIYLKAVSAIAVLTFPMMMGLFAVAPDFVLVILGEKWVPMVPVLQILCWVGMLQSIGTTVGTIYLSTGNVRQMFFLALAGTLVIVFGVVVGLNWGIVGVAAGYALAGVSLFHVSTAMALRLVNVPVSDFYRVLARPFIASLAMLLTVELLAVGLEAAPAEARLAASIAAGVATYALLSLMVNRRQVTEIASVVRDAVRRS